MTEEEIKWNIAIAEFTGEWKDCRYDPGDPYGFEDILGIPKLENGWADYEDTIPYWYHKDLNAIHDVEKFILPPLVSYPDTCKKIEKEEEEYSDDDIPTESPPIKEVKKTIWELYSWNIWAIMTRDLGTWKDWCIYTLAIPYYASAAQKTEALYNAIIENTIKCE